jgi:hypothetical protein
MSRMRIAMIIVASLLAACSTMGRITVKDYQAATGERVMAGQAEPKSAYNCQQVSKESAASNWGLKAGLFNEADAIDRITVAAVNAAPAKGANYAHVILPSEFGPPGLNVNAFRDVYVAHYKCANLPAPQP